MLPFTLSPIEGKSFARQTLVVFVIALAVLFAFPWSLSANNRFIAGISITTTLLFVSAIAALPIVGAVGLILRNFASRLLTLGLPVSLTAAAFMLVLNDLAMGLVFNRHSLLRGNILILAGLLGAVAIMRPVGNWRHDQITRCFVGVVALIGFDQYASLIRAMLLPGTDGTFLWSLQAARLTGLPKLLGLPSGSVPGGLLFGLGYMQRRLARDVPSHQFTPIPLGGALMAAIVFGVATSTVMYMQFDAATGAGSPRRLSTMVPLNSLLYAVPAFCFLVDSAIKRSKLVWFSVCFASLLPIVAWVGQRHLVDWRAIEVAQLNAKPIDWSAVPIRGRPLMVDVATPDIEAQAQRRGFASTFNFRYSQKVYVRGVADERFNGPDDFIEITLGAHKPGKRFSAESGRPRSPAILHVYDVRDGKRTLLGTRVVERYVPPAFPPYLDFDGSWVVDRARILEASDADMIVRILDEIPS